MNDERAQVVAWLGEQAVELKDAGPIGKIIFAVLLDAARKIERGEHLATKP